MRALRKLGRAIVMKAVHYCGTRVFDHVTGAMLGRAFIFAWRGKIHVIGLQKPVRIVWRAQQRLTYWKQEIVFTAHTPPNFASDPELSRQQAESSRPNEF